MKYVALLPPSGCPLKLETKGQVLGLEVELRGGRRKCCGAICLVGVSIPAFPQTPNYPFYCAAGRQQTTTGFPLFLKEEKQHHQPPLVTGSGSSTGQLEALNPSPSEASLLSAMLSTLVTISLRCWQTCGSLGKASGKDRLGDLHLFSATLRETCQRERCTVKCKN